MPVASNPWSSNARTRRVNLWAFFSRAKPLSTVIVDVSGFDATGIKSREFYCEIARGRIGAS
jgi:hypothetical protein